MLPLLLLLLPVVLLLLPQQQCLQRCCCCQHQQCRQLLHLSRDLLPLLSAPQQRLTPAPLQLLHVC
jgi:hypothetical protein